MAEAEIRRSLHSGGMQQYKPNYQILGGSAIFVRNSCSWGSPIYLEKGIYLYWLAGRDRLSDASILKGLDPRKRRDILGIAIIIFIFRAMPTIGAGASWWQIDVLHFDEAFFGTLRQISSILAIIGSVRPARLDEQAADSLPGHFSLGLQHGHDAAFYRHVLWPA